MLQWAVQNRVTRGSANGPKVLCQCCGEMIEANLGNHVQCQAHRHDDAEKIKLYNEVFFSANARGPLHTPSLVAALRLAVHMDDAYRREQGLPVEDLPAANVFNFRTEDRDEETVQDHIKPNFCVRETLRNVLNSQGVGLTDLKGQAVPLYNMSTMFRRGAEVSQVSCMI